MNDNKRVIIDYLSATFPLIVSEAENEQERSIQTFRLFREFFGLAKCECRSEPYATNNFKYQYTLKEFITLRCDGPVNSNGERTCQLELKGEGCREFERIANGKTWVDLFELLYGMDVVFKRIDITIDDLSGMEISQKYIYKKLRNNEYTSIFKSEPKYHGLIDEGFTIELGGRRSTTQLVIYDKRLEQLQKHKICDESYWVRYEMRFRGAKADAVVLELLTNYKNNDDPINGLNIQSFAKAQLLSTLDLKKGNNYDEAHKCKAPTDPKWLAFLDDTDKAELPKIEERETTYESRRAFLMPKAAVIIETWFMMKNQDFDLYFHDLTNEIYNLLSKFSDKQKKRLNECLLENGIEPLDEAGFDNLKMKFYEKVVDMELPF